MIKVNHINKTFKVAKRKAGVLSSIKSLFFQKFTKVQALQDISFSIKEGEIVGYIGPNGAGKSTTIKIMSGILTPDSGTCKILDKTPWLERIEHVKNIGVVFGQRSQLWWDVPVVDSFELIKDIYRITDAHYEETLNLLTDSLNLHDILKTPVRQLSLGQRIRCEIAASLLHNPKILFLDEPTIGLDAVSKIAVRNFIKAINEKRKTTVILTTHDMSDIEALATRIILIGKGQLLYDGNLEHLKEKYITHKKIIVDHYEYQSKIDLPYTEVLKTTPDRTILSVNIKEIKVSSIIQQLSGLMEIHDITVEDPPVEEIIVDLYREYEI
ncbi:MAG: ATP-binding cassette domain-containing protein [Clostridia bacterium]|nr:ATP-binding cassette domain-containing protein [Clostridia bacterium]